MKALYRKYRPTKLEDVVGQEAVTTTLSNSLKQGKVGHAYLFIGPRGTGKTSVARILAHAVNGFKYELEDSYLDIVEIDAASNTGVDNIRELREKAIIAPTKGKYKVYIIDEVHMLSKSAANALLKTIEEPPEHVIFIMATTEANKVPITISSRTQTLTFKLASPEVMLGHLEKIAKKEKLAIEKPALEIIARRGGGSYRDTLSLLDQVTTLTDKKITAELLNQALGLPEDQALKEILAAYASGESEKLRETLKDLLNSGISAENIAAELIQRIVETPDPVVLPLLEALPNVTAPFASAKLLVALLKTSSANLAPMAVSQKRPSEASQKPQTAVLSAAQDAPVAAPEAASEEVSKKLSDTPVSKENAPEASTEATDSKKPQPPVDFSWENLLEILPENHPAIYNQLRKCEHELSNNTLYLITENQFTIKFFKRAENAQALAGYLPEGIAIEVRGKTVPKDSELSKLSETLGEVQDFSGDVPF